jgi:hypothetical protein
VHLESDVVEIPPGGVLDWELPAEGATRLEVEVLDADGRPVDEGPCRALVLIDDKRNFRWCSSTPGKGPIVFCTYGREIESYTGTPEVAIVADGRGVSAPRPVERTQGQWVHLKAHLKPFARIDGKVVGGQGEGEPVAGATVVAECMPFDATECSISLRRMTASDLEGRFQLVDLIPGRYILWAHAPGAAGTLLDPVAVDFEEARELTIRLTPGGRVRGRVEDRGGSPVDGAAIWFRFGPFDDSEGQNLSRPHCFTDADGVFFFDGLPPGLPIQGHVCGVTRDGQSVEDHVVHVQVKEGETVDMTVQIP